MYNHEASLMDKGVGPTVTGNRLLCTMVKRNHRCSIHDAHIDNMCAACGTSGTTALRIVSMTTALHEHPAPVAKFLGVVSGKNSEALVALAAPSPSNRLCVCRRPNRHTRNNNTVGVPLWLSVLRFSVSFRGLSSQNQ